MTIFCHYEGFGWRAHSPDPEANKMKSPHCSGPRQAAEALCSALFPKGTWRLKREATRVYQVEFLP